MLDPLTHAVRPDLADIRLAGRVFAPYFAAAVPCRAIADAAVTLSPHGGTAVAQLSPADRFDVLEIAGTLAWGIAVDPGLVGYVDRDALEAAA